MKYEEKYKEALKVIENLYNVVKYQSSSDALLTCQTIEKAFPELRESEDERIRKGLINMLSQDYELHKKEIAWLEKQGTMSRKEEIQRKAGDLADFGISHCQPNQQQYYEGFIDGAEWADEHPKKGLWDAEKVVKWILENADKHIWYDETENECGITDDFIKDLQKAMEG